MKFKILPPCNVINNLFKYEDGFLYWSKTNSNRATKGAKAGYVSKTDGYIYVRLNKERFSAHRLIWKIIYKEDPKGQIDHIDGNKLNNNIENLRIVTNSENARNSKINKKNKSGVTGVSFCNKTNKWLASIRVNYIKKNLGLYKKKEDAIKARKIAEKEFLFHENHGKK